jgi:hypothetical protein
LPSKPGTPAIGRPKQTKKKTRISGMPRKKSMYTTARTRNGSPARPGATRMSTSTSAQSSTATSATSIILMLIRNPSRISGKLCSRW